jgi:regulator of protease activity HflC (stomatin/prohibitin superfamily)
MNRSLTQSLLLGALLLLVVFVLRAACVPLGPWQTAVVFRGNTPVEAVHGPGLVWVVPVLHSVRVYDARTRTVSGAVPWSGASANGASPAKGTFVYAATWRIADPLLYARLGDPATGRRKVADRIATALQHLVGKAPIAGVLAPSTLRPKLAALAHDLAGDGVALVSVRPETLRWSPRTLKAYVVRRKKVLAARFELDLKRDAAERAFLAEQQRDARRRVLDAARRAARLERAHAEARALDLEIAAARPAPSFFADLVRLETLERVLSPPSPLPAASPAPSATAHHEVHHGS